MSDSNQQLRLKIEPVVERADELSAIVARDLSTHKGLCSAARGVANASRNAQRVATQLHHLLGLHRIPALFLLLSLGGVAFWVYWYFIHNSTLVIALSARDAVELKNAVGHRVQVVSVETHGSRENIALLQEGEVDLAFVQGGLEIPEGLVRSKLESSELVLFFVREGIEDVSQIGTLLTSSEGQGSHTIAEVFARAWRIDGQLDYVFDWRELTDNSDYRLDDVIDAVLVVKDPMSPQVTGAVARLSEAEFHLATPDIGAHRLRLPYLDTFEVPAGFLDPVSHVPSEDVTTYSVATYLVARSDLTPRQMAAANQLHGRVTDPFASAGFEPTFDRASEVAQGIEAMVGVLVYVGLAFIALLGLDIMTYRRHFNELNTLVSLISMHQSSKDAVTGDADQRAHNIQYLRVCSDLLGLISVITGYYAQENSSLLYNRLPEIIHDRCDALKINIQLKILHGLTQFESAAVVNESLAGIAEEGAAEAAKSVAKSAGDDKAGSAEAAS